MGSVSDSEAILEAVRSDSRAVVLLREVGGSLSLIAASDPIRAAVGPSDDALISWVEDLGGAEMLHHHAETRQRLEISLEGERGIAASVRRQAGDVFQIRGSFVDRMDVSNTMTASAIATLSNDDIGVIFLDEKLRLLAVNEAYYKFFPAADGFPNIGGHLGEMVRMAIELGYLPQARDGEERFIQSTIENFESRDARTLTVLTGHGIWLNTSRLRFRNGAIAILLIDITETQKELEQFRSFMRNTHNMIYARVSPDLKSLKIWGQDSEPVLNSRESGRLKLGEWLSVVHPDDLPAYLEAGQKRIDEGTPYRIEYRFTDFETGELRWMHENAWVTENPVTGERHLDAYLIDITDRKRVEDELHHREERFREFATIAADWYFEADEDMVITYLSDSFEAVSGLDPTRFIGLNWETITRDVLQNMPEEHSQPWIDLLNAWKLRRPVRNLPLLFRFGRGNNRQININGEPIFDARGRYLGYRGVSKDVTSLIAAQQEALSARRKAEAANRAKSEFIANMSHELRTPLNAIIGFAGVMEKQMFGPIGSNRYRDYASDISASGQHLLSLVNDILDLSRIEADRQNIEPEAIELPAELERAVDLFRDEAGNRSITVQAAPGLSAAFADRRSLRQIIINLLNNAIKFTGETGMIRLGAGDDGDMVTIHVQDDGIGMSEEDLGLALEPFGRAVNPEIAGGTGLGLPITRKLAELNGGGMDIESSEGSGTKVTIRLPRPPGALDLVESA